MSNTKTWTSILESGKMAIRMEKAGISIKMGRNLTAIPTTKALL